MARDKYHLKIIAFAGIGLMVVAQMMAERALYADGAYFVFKILLHKNFYTDNDASRLFVYWFTQFPIVLAVKLGVSNLDVLRHLFTSWLAFAPILFWGAALWKLRDDIVFWPCVMLFVLSYFCCSFFLIGEYNLAYALSGFCLALLIRDQKNSLPDLGLLAFAALLSIMSYASTLFIGILLGAIACWRWRQENKRPLKFYWAILACLFFASSAVGINGYVNPGNPESKTRALETWILFKDHELWLIVGTAVTLLVQFFIRSKKIRYTLCALVLAALSLNLFQVFRAPPVAAYPTRLFCGGFLFLGSLVLAWIKLDIWPRNYKKRQLADFPPVVCVAPVFLLLITYCVFDMCDSLSYGRYIDDFRQTIHRPEPFVSFQEFRLTVANDAEFSWCWTYPTMSLILRHSPHEAIALNPNGCLANQPYDPLKSVPDLSAYYPQGD